MRNMMISLRIFIISKFWFSWFLEWGGVGGGVRWKEQKTPKIIYFILLRCLPVSGTVDHIIKIFGTWYKIMISPGVFFIFKKECNIVNIKIILFFLLAHFNSFFNKYLNICFSSSSVNAIKKFWDVPPPSSHVFYFN